MNYHFFVFTDGKPLSIHNHQQPTAVSYYIYTPPERSKPYIFKANEAIYAILFPMSNQDRDQTSCSGQWCKRIPERLEPTIVLLDLIFSKSMDNYARIFMELSRLLSGDLLLVTERGVRNCTLLTSMNSAVTTDCILVPDDQKQGVEFFMNIVEHNLTKHNLPVQEAFNNACATNVLGDYLNTSIPIWWIKAVQQYGTEVSRELSKASH